jgi:hypothetical protein
MTLRHHLVTMTNGKSLAKTNQRIFFALIMFLVWIMFFHSTSCNAFAFGVHTSRRSPNMPSKTVQLTNNGPAIATSSFLQLPHEGPAHFKQTFVPMSTASTGLQADKDHHSSLNGITAPQAFFATTSTMTVTMTKVPAIATAITKAPQIQFNKNKLTQTQQKTSTISILHPVKMTFNNATSPSLFLLRVEDNSEIMAPSLLFFDVKEVSAIMAATHANSMLQLIVASIQWVPSAQNTIPIPKKFIVALCSEGAKPASTLLFSKPHGRGLIVDSTSIPYSEGAQASQNNFNDSKIFLHFHEDCGIFCEGEWEQIIKRDGIAIINENNRNNLQLSDIGLIILIHFGLITISSFAGLVGLIGFIGHISLICHSGLFGFGLDNHNGFVNIFSLVGIGFVSLDCLVSLISLINLSALSNHRPIGLIGIISFSLIALSASAVLLAH